MSRILAELVDEDAREEQDREEEPVEAARGARRGEEQEAEQGQQREVDLHGDPEETPDVQRPAHSVTIGAPALR